MKIVIYHKSILLLIFSFLLPGIVLSQGPYLGTTMGFTDYLENRCGIVYKENNVPKDPFQSLADHGATIVRLRVDHPPFSSSYSNGELVDHSSSANVKKGLQRAHSAGLKTLLTFGYQSWALEDNQRLNPYVAPLAWQEVALDLNRITDSVYNFTYNVLDDYCSEGLIPEIVSIGNESSWHRLMPNVPESGLPEYDPARSVALHNAGSKAVRDISAKYGVDIKVCFHMMGPSVTRWWLEEHTPYELDYDIIGISLYHAWNDNDYAGYASLGDFVRGMINIYGTGFLIMETAQLFRTGGNDNHVDILGTENIPPGYPNPPTTDTQKEYLTDITMEVLNNGGLGVIVWGGEWVGCDCYIYADQWGKGSSWENKAFWDFDYNLHDGVNWMQSFGYTVPVTFKADMTGVDVSNGVYVTGDFPNGQGEQWQFNQMAPEGDNIYSYTTEIKVGTAGAYYFLNDDDWDARETVPPECVVHNGHDRGYVIPAGSEGETFGFVWSGCNKIQSVSTEQRTRTKNESLFMIIRDPNQNNQLNLLWMVSDQVNISMYDVQGRMFREIQMNSTAGQNMVFDIPSFVKGLYIVKVCFNRLGRYESKMVLFTERAP